MTWWTGCAVTWPGRSRWLVSALDATFARDRAAAGRHPGARGVPPGSGTRDVQTTLDLYAHVTDDADLRAVASWRAFTAGWRTGPVPGEQAGAWS